MYDTTQARHSRCKGWAARQIAMFTSCLPEKRGHQIAAAQVREENAPPKTTVRSHSKASKPLRRCDSRHCGRHGTCSSCNTMRSEITTSLMSPPRAALCQLIGNVRSRLERSAFTWQMSFHKLTHVSERVQCRDSWDFERCGSLRDKSRATANSDPRWP